MPDQSHFIGGGTTDSVLSPIVLVGMLIGILLMLLLPRRFVIVPFLLCIFLIPLGQQIYLGGVHWLVGRILVLAGLLKISISKVGSKGNFLPGGYNSIDRAFLWCTLAESICVVLQYMQSQALINQFGFLIDYLGAYFLLRALIQDKKDIYTAIKCMALLSVILAFFMVREQQTLHNAFGTLGGVQSVPDVREGKTRSQGVFQHALMAGTFAASLLPLFLLLGKNGKSKLIAFIGIAGCTVMTITSQSSTPLLAYVSGVLIVCLWPLRKRMQLVRRGIVGVLLGLAMVMKAPVWFVIAHIDLTGGSSGYHRAELIDTFIKHFSDWWLIGTKDIASWGFDMWDTQNQYVNVGETGGLVAFILFICMISRCFARIGDRRKAVEGRSSQVWFLWLLGAALFAHLVSFFGVNYFDQSKVNWFLLLAMISAATRIPQRMRTTKPEEGAAGMDRNVNYVPEDTVASTLAILYTEGRYAE
jgi:phosphate starvation-inducible membrane PsiE